MICNRAEPHFLTTDGTLKGSHLPRTVEYTLEEGSRHLTCSVNFIACASKNECGPRTTFPNKYKMIYDLAFTHRTQCTFDSLLSYSAR